MAQPDGNDHTQTHTHTINTAGCKCSLSALPVVEEVAGFDIPVNDVVRVDIPQSLEQGQHVQSDLLQRHVTQIVLHTNNKQVYKPCTLKWYNPSFHHLFLAHCNAILISPMTCITRC